MIIPGKNPKFKVSYMITDDDPLRSTLGLQNITTERLLDFLPYPFLISDWRDGDQRNLFLNKQFQQEIGFTLAEIPTITDWFKLAYPDPEYQAEVIKKWQKKSTQAARLNRNSVSMKARIHTKLRGPQWYQVKASIDGNVNLVAFININEEVTREFELERENENKNQTLSVLTHDLRGPLNNLMAILRLSGQGHITQEEYAKSVNSLSNNLFKLIEFFDTTLQWTRSNFSNVNTSFQRIDLTVLIPEILQIFETQYEEKKISVDMNFDQLSSVWGDHEIIAIVSRNIISNAIKFTGVNGSLSITAFKQGNTAVVSFKDTGNGMTPDRIQMIVDKNYTSEKGTAGERGAGLGLRLCNQLLHKIGGRLEIESVLNQGTTVRITL